MNKPEENQLNGRADHPPPVSDRPDSWWYGVYLAVIVFTVLVISALGVFSWYFSH